MPLSRTPRSTSSSKPRVTSRPSAFLPIRFFRIRIVHLRKRPIGRPPHAVRRFYANFSYQEQSWKKPRLSCCSFAANAVRLQLHALAYNLANFMRTLALPEKVKHWSLTSLQEKLVKIGAKIVAHARYVTFQMAEVAVPSQLFEEILRMVDGLRPRSTPA